MASLIKQRTEKLYAAFGTVATNGGALHFADQAIGHAEAAREDLAGYPWDIAAQNAIRSLGECVRQVQRFAGPFRGSPPNAALAKGSWAELRHSIGGTYALIWAIDDTLPPEGRETFGSLVASITADAVKALPQVIDDTLGYVGDVAGTVVGGAGGVASNVLLNFLKGAWPILLVAGVIVGAGVYLATSTAAGRAVVKARMGA